MDKREYQEKLSEINSLIAGEKYEEAAKVADTIDWKRVRNVQTLVMISEIYEAVGRYDDSKILLLRAYRRSPLGRTVLYRLVECTIKLGQFDQAIEYYSEYVQASPHDNNKYILKYKIYRGRGSSLDEQIEILQEYLKQEYNEKWAYELARLQIQADRVQEGLATCDDLVLWFQSGKYVIKALELKKKYAPLTPKQQEIYDNRFEDHDEEELPEGSDTSYLQQAQSLARAQRAAAEQEEIKSELAEDISHTAQLEASKEELTRKAEEAQAEIDEKAARSEMALAGNSGMTSQKAQEAAKETAAQAQETVQETAAQAQEMAEETAAQAQETVRETAAQAQEMAEETAAQAQETAEETAAQAQEMAEETAAQAQEMAEETAAQAQEMAEETAAQAREEAEETASEVRETAAEQTFVTDQTAAAATAAAGAAAAAGTFAQEAAELAGVRTAESSAGQADEPDIEIPAFEKLAETPAAAEKAAQETFARETADLSGGRAAGEPLFERETQETAAAENAAEETTGESAEEVSEGAFAGTAEEISEGAFAETAEEAVAETAEEISEEAVAETAEENIEEYAEETADAAMQEPEENTEVSREQMQEDMARSMREIVSGVGTGDGIGEEEAVLDEVIDQSKADQENAVAARGAGMTFSVPASEASRKRAAGRLTIDDILLSMSDKGEHVRDLTSKGVLSASEEAKDAAEASEVQAPAGEQVFETDQTAASGAAAPAAAGIQSGPEAGALNEAKTPGVQASGTEQAFAADQAEAEPESAVQGVSAEEENEGLPAGDEDPQIPGFLRDEVREAKQTSEIPSSVIAEADDARRREMEDDNASAADQDEPAQDSAQALAAAFLSTPRVAYTKEIAEAKTKKLPVEEIRQLHEAYLAEGARTPASAGAGPVQDQESEEDDDIRIAPDRVKSPYAADVQAEEGISGTPDAGYDDGDADADMDALRADGSDTGAQSGDGTAARAGVQMTREVPKTAPEPQVMTSRARLRENQMELFSGFTEIGTLSEQIAAAIWQAENRKNDRTSRSGNILILGAHGCGKTTIATGIAKAIAEDMGTHSIKMARIYAADLNRKDIAATVAKIAGGVLIIEEAGDLDDAIVDQLTTAMEFRTDGLIVILEDEQRYIHDLLMRHPRFTMKFTAQIYIPEYTGEDLLNFGRIYAESRDYVFSEGASEMFLSRVEAAKKGGENVSVTNVVELVDRAIKNANTFFRRIGSSKKRYDEMDRVILKEKDFR